MKFLRCPHCDRQAVKIWEMFVFPSPFWLNKLCRHCRNKIRFDFRTIRLIVYLFLLGMVLGNVINLVVPIHSIMFDVVFLLLFACIPIFLGRKLFVSVDGGRGHA